MHRHLLFAGIICFGMINTAHAQTDFDEWKRRQEAAFESFRSEQDKAFVDFLKEKWEAFEAFKEPGRDEAPKPIRIPPFQADEPTPMDVIIIDEPLPPPLPLPAPIALAPEQDVAPTPVPEVPPPPGMKIDFFGTEIMIPASAVFPPPVRGTIDQQKIATYWAEISNTPYEPALKALQVRRRQMKLNDWGYARLLYATARQVYPTSTNARRLFMWFMMSKSGYLAKVGYEGNEIVLLLPAKQTLYSTTYFTVESHTGKFYVARFEPSDRADVQSILTYKGDYPGALRRIDMRITEMPAIGDDRQTKILKFTHWGKDYTAPVTVNRTIARFFENYPQTGYDIYFAAPLSSGAREALVPALKNLSRGLSEKDAVNLILHFVQTAFDYQTDDEQFNREKPLFPDETLYYPSSDCEDRAVLFAYLVRNVIGSDVIGLAYPGHIATAVRFDDQVPGMRVQYDGKTYVICVPTFINADIGRPIPQVQSATPNVIWAMP